MDQPVTPPHADPPPPHGRRLLDPGSGREVELVYVLPGGALAAPEEPSLADLLGRIWRRRVLIVAVVLLVTGAVAGWVSSRPDVYASTVLIQIGSDSRGEVLESLPQVRERLLNVYLHDELDPQGEPWEVDIEVLPDTRLIRITSEGTLAELEARHVLLSRLAALIVADHAPEIARERAREAEQIARLERLVAGSEPQADLLQALGEAHRQQDAIRETSIVQAVTRSVEPVGPRRLLPVVGVALASLMALGFLALVLPASGRDHHR